MWAVWFTWRFQDLKPDNILVEPTGVCKISDFGISKRADDMYSPRAHTLMRGTVQYMAPEILGSKEKGYDGKIDIWSVGCMVLEMWSGEKPWGAGENFMAIMLKVCWVIIHVSYHLTEPALVAGDPITSAFTSPATKRTTTECP